MSQSATPVEIVDIPVRECLQRWEEGQLTSPDQVFEVASAIGEAYRFSPDTLAVFYLKLAQAAHTKFSGNDDHSFEEFAKACNQTDWVNPDLKGRFFFMACIHFYLYGSGRRAPSMYENLRLITCRLTYPKVRPILEFVRAHEQELLNPDALRVSFTQSVGLKPVSHQFEPLPSTVFLVQTYFHQPNDFDFSRESIVPKQINPGGQTEHIALIEFVLVLAPHLSEVGLDTWITALIECEKARVTKDKNCYCRNNQLLRFLLAYRFANKSDIEFKKYLEDRSLNTYFEQNWENSSSSAASRSVSTSGTFAVLGTVFAGINNLHVTLKNFMNQESNRLKIGFGYQPVPLVPILQAQVVSARASAAPR